ncbi:MAG: hypothetical protein Q9227_002172 [Pyrenula ochraceoflavens]
MSSSLLNCTICPKNPNFSDISHLLTHVSSKGHLSHLHKLQVLSHQEPTAGQRLAIYNSWYHNNGIGHLLSERLLQKQSKKSKSRARSFPATAALQPRRPKTLLRTATTSTLDTVSSARSDRDSISDSLDSLDYLSGLQRPSTSLSGSISVKSDEDSDYDSSPTGRYSKRHGKKTKLVIFRLPGGESDDENGLDHEPFETWDDEEDHSRLKGVFWPGMSIFDAAPEEMKRKRNQKKDGSLLKQMVKTSEVVEPQEVIYSPGGSLARIREITGVVDDSDPLPGETPIPKKKPPRTRRAALAPLSSNLHHRLRRESRGIKAATRPNNLTERGHRRTVSYGFSTRRSSLNPTSHFSPTEDENLDSRFSVGKLKPNSGHFPLYQDHHGSQQVPTRPAPAFPDGLPDYKLPAFSYSPGNIAKPGLNMLNMPTWLRPPQTEQKSFGIFSPGRQYPAKAPFAPGYDAMAKAYAESFAHRNHVTVSNNPFGWDGALSPFQDQSEIHSSQAVESMSSSSNIDIPNGHDISGYGVNPLSVAFQQLQDPFGPGRTLPSSGEKSDSRQTVAVSPDGTLTDPGFDLTYQP